MYQGEVVGVDPDDAEVGVVCVLASHLLQNLQEFSRGKGQRSGRLLGRLRFRPAMHFIFATYYSLELEVIREAVSSGIFYQSMS